MKYLKFTCLLLSLLLTSCDKDDESNNSINENPLNISFGETTFDNYGEIIYQDHTIVLNENLKNNLTEVNDNYISFNYSNSFDLLEEGDILFSGQSDLAPNGFARKVTSIEKNNNIIKFNTIQATAEEVFEKVDYQQELSLDFENITNLNGSDSTAARSNLSPSKSVEFNVNNDRIEVTLLFDYDNNFQTEIDQLELSGFVEISHIVSPNLVYNFDVFDSSNNILSINGLSDIKVGGELTYGGRTSNEFVEDDFINADTNQPLEIDKWFNLLSIPLTGLYSPGDLIVQPEIVIFARFKIDITGKLYVEFSKDFRYNYVVSYQGSNTGNGWDNDIEELLDDSWSFDYGATAEIDFEATPFAVGPIIAFPQFLFQGNNPSYLGIFIYPWTQNVNASINLNSSNNCFETNITQQNKWEAKLEANISTIFNNNSSINVDIPIYSQPYSVDEGFTVPDFCFSDNTLPVISTANVTNITVNSATSGGIILDDGGSNITVKGVCWSLNQNPTINDPNTNDGDGVGNFSSLLTNLNSNSTYYVRAYAINEQGIAYGNQVIFETESNNNPTLSVITNPVTNITANSALSGGNVTDDGGSAVTSKGVCWSTNPNPTVGNNITNDGSGIGEYTSAMTNLIANTTYYVKAYATNVEETVYGDEVSFTTLASSGNVFNGVAFLASQEEVDQFGSNNYTEINGTVYIGTFDGDQNVSDINDLSPLSSVINVFGSLEIYNNPQLLTLQGLGNINTLNNIYILNTNISNLDGLNNIDNINQLVVDSCSSLTSLDGLNSEVEILNQIQIQNNPNLNNLSGLINITSITGGLFIDNNNSLIDLTGLGNLVNVGGSIFIRDNSMLVSLNGLENINHIGNYFEITGNNILTDFCSLQNFLSNTDIIPYIVNNQYNPSKQDIIAGNCSS